MPIQTIAATPLLDGAQLLQRRQEVAKEEAAIAMVGGLNLWGSLRESLFPDSGHVDDTITTVLGNKLVSEPPAMNLQRLQTKHNRNMVLI